MSREHVVTVGVDGSRASWAALDWAADDAVRTGRSLVVVHVGHVSVLPNLAFDGALGAKILDESVDAIANSRPGLTPKTGWLGGDPVDRLTELSASCDLLVVGRSRHTVAGPILGSVADGVLRHAHCPVVVVPQGTQVGTNTVVVGASNTPGGQAALRFAFEEAAGRRADLVVVRSWTGFDCRTAKGPIPRMADVDAWQAREQALLGTSLEPLRLAFPDLKVRTVVTHEPVELALEQEAHSAAMVVLGCRRPDDRGHLSRVGYTAAWAAHHFYAPVVVVGHSQPAVDRDRIDSKEST